MKKILITGGITASVIIYGLISFGPFPLNAQDQPFASMSSAESNIKGGDYGTVTSLLVMQNGAIVYEGYFNGANADTLHNTRSVTKTMTGMAVGAAVDDGVLDINTPAARFFSDIAPFENPDPRKLEITTKDLITMSSILECDDNDIFSRGNESRMSIVEDWASFYWDLPIRGYPGWMPKPATSKYGRAFAYCSAGVEIAGRIAERASGKTLQAYFKEKFFNPLEITHFEWQENGLGEAHKSGGLGLTTRGLAKFGELHRAGGRYKGQQILSAKWIEEATSPHVVIDEEAGTEYGYTWWLSSYDVGGKHHKNYYMTGNGGNRVVVMPDHGLVVVLTKTDYNSRGMHQKSDELFEKEIVRRLKN